MSVSVRVCLCVLGVERLANKFILIAKRILQAPSLSPVPPLLYVQTVRPERKKAHGPSFSYCFSLLVNSETVPRLQGLQRLPELARDWLLNRQVSGRGSLA